METELFTKRLMELQDNLLSFAYTLTSNKNDAQDLLQDTTLKALDNQDKYEENTNFKGWVFTIMRNIFINNYRKMIKSQTVIVQTKDWYLLNLPQDSGLETPEGFYTMNEITECVNSFTEEYKVTFSMHISGFKYYEIAEELGIPMGTVKSRICYARKKIKEALKDYGW